MDLTSEQADLLRHPITDCVFIHGPAGAGKTTAGIHWLRKLLQSGVPGNEILVYTPQKMLAQPYEQFLWEEPHLTHTPITTLTLGTLARRMVDLFWPLIADEAGFYHPQSPPHFLTLETAQYFMAYLVSPLIRVQGFFDSLTINPNRIYSQILDNLNKAAIVGFPANEISARLKSAWVGSEDQFHIYDDVQYCADLFRSFCYKNNLLDFSLQVEIFSRYLWQNPSCREYMRKMAKHLIADNIEEDPPVSHDILRVWLPDFASALLIMDDDAGYRFFLGADVQSAQSLARACHKTSSFTSNLISSEEIVQLDRSIAFAASQLTEKNMPSKPAIQYQKAIAALEVPTPNPRFFPEMVAWAVSEIQALIRAGTPPGEIAILAPFMSDVLRFTLTEKLINLNIPYHSHRPSRALRDEPVVQMLLTFAAIAFPEWQLNPKRIDCALALVQAIDGLDLVRAQLLTAYVFQQNADGFKLSPFEDVPANIRERVTYHVGEKYEQLRQWLLEAEADQNHTLDFFLSRLFGEVLGQPGFRLHNQLTTANTVANLIESIQKFRWATDRPNLPDSFSIGREYVQMVTDGVIAANYISAEEPSSSEAVFIAPAYTFLIRNQPVDYQVWLDIGSPSWYQRLDQPLTQPYVLSRHWHAGDVWDSEDEYKASLDNLRRITHGLLRRCRRKIYVGMSEIDVSGYENKGLLLRILQHVLLEARRSIS